MDSNEEYRARLEDIIRDAALTGLSDLQSISQHCKGAFPTELIEIVDTKSFSVTAQSPFRNQGESSINHLLPEAHPIDYDWRFSSDTASTLAGVATELGSKICCLGTPTVFIELMQRNVCAILVDRNSYMVELCNRHFEGQAYLADVREFQHETAFDVVVMDPPWYVDDFKVWMSAAVNLTRPGGTILSTMFPELVRPSASAERHELLGLFRNVGSLEILKTKVVYETPDFEKATLIANDLPPLNHWRIGELIMVTHENDIERLYNSSVTETRWERFRFGTQVVALRKSFDDLNDIVSVESPYSDGSFILKSVSARDPVRNNIDLWTSRNKVMKVKGQKKLFTFLSLLEQGELPSTAINKLVTTEEEKFALNSVLALLGL